MLLTYEPSRGDSPRLQWMMLGRLLICFVLLGTISVHQIIKFPSHDINLVKIGLSILACLFCLNFIQALFLKYIPEHWLVGVLNVLVDNLGVTAWLVFSLSPSSPIVLIYLLTILISALAYFRIGAFLSSAISSVCFLFVTLKIFGAEQDALFSWGVYTAIFFSVGLVGGYLSEELRRTAEGLQEKKQEIQKINALYERIIEGMPTGLLTLNEDMTVAFLNPGAQTILGKKKEGIVGKQLQEVEPDLLPFFEQIEGKQIEDELDDSKLSPMDTELTATGSEWHRSIFLKARLEKGLARLQQTVELGNGKNRRVLRGDVAEIAISESIGTLFAQAKGIGRVLLFQDVTKLVHLEDKLKQHEKFAAVGQLAAGIAHEIRNPLASMSASIQMLQEGVSGTDLQAEDKRLMEIIGKEIARLNQLITEFLGFVKPEKFNPQPIDLEKMLSEVVLQVKNSQDLSKGVLVQSALKSKVLALGSEEKLKQIVWNLLTNAAQAMRNPGVIEVGCSEVSPHWVCFWVSDQGEGMSEEVLQHLYEPFFTTKSKGTGLGLATVYKIVEAHQGEIKVQSKPGQGTRFEIHLHKG